MTYINCAGSFSRLWLIALLTITGADYTFAYEPTTLEIGAAAPDFDLPGVDGKRYSLSDFEDNQVLVVIFTTNHCPDAIASYGRMGKLVDKYRDKGVGFVAINGNDPRAVMLNEMRWSEHDDSYESMKVVAKEEGFNLPYLYDGETQVVTKAYGAVATPHVFIFDRKRQLRYMGRLDDGRRNPRLSAKSEAGDAIDALLLGKSVTVEKTPVFGCSIKWAETRALVEQEEQEWKKRPVSLTDADASVIKEKVVGKNSSLRLINVWSTTCGPCILEFPHLVELYRRFQNHPFEFITISVDAPAERDEVESILQDQHVALARRTERLLKSSGRTTNNLLFSGGDLKELATVLDEQWSGVQPYTMLVAPNGEVLFRQAGSADIEKLRAAIVKFVRAEYLK